LNSLQIIPNSGLTGSSTPGGVANAGSTTTGGTSSANQPSSQSLNSVPLSGVASVTLGQGPSQIPRQNKARRVDIDAPLAGGAVLGDVLGQVTNVMNSYTFPQGYRWQYGPAVTQENDTFGVLPLVVILAIALIYIPVASQFQSFLDPPLIMMAVPYPLIGIL